MKRITLAVAVCLALAAPAARAAEDAKTLFAQKCASCHGPDGKSQTAMGKKLGAKDLTQEKEPVEVLVKDIEDGKPPKMAAYKGKLTPEQIKALATYIKGGLK